MLATRPIVYAMHGLRLRSPVPLGGFPAADGDHDIDVTWAAGGPVPRVVPAGRLAAGATAGDGTYLYMATDGGSGRWTVRVPGICDFLVDHPGRAVECRLDPAADRRLVAVLVSGLVVSVLLALDGHCVLHASAVELDGFALAFAGPSGAGKSTLATLLCAAGARLITDDVLRLGLTPHVGCIGGSPHLRLRPTASWALGGFADPPVTGSTVDNRLAVTPAVTSSASVPLAAVVLPRLSWEAAAVVLRPATGAAAVAWLASVGRVAGWTDAGVLRAQFRAMAAVAASIPIVEATIPWGTPSAASQIADDLVELMVRR